MLGTPCSELVWRLLATHSIRQFPLHFSSRASPCAITFQLDSTLWQALPCSVLIGSCVSLRTCMVTAVKIWNTFFFQELTHVFSDVQPVAQSLYWLTYRVFCISPVVYPFSKCQYLVPLRVQSRWQDERRITARAMRTECVTCVSSDLWIVWKRILGMDCTLRW
jgi:hypothetical protein